MFLPTDTDVDHVNASHTYFRAQLCSAVCMHYSESRVRVTAISILTHFAGPDTMKEGWDSQGES